MFVVSSIANLRPAAPAAAGARVTTKTTTVTAGG